MHGTNEGGFGLFRRRGLLFPGRGFWSLWLSRGGPPVMMMLGRRFASRAGPGRFKLRGIGSVGGNRYGEGRQYGHRRRFRSLGVGGIQREGADRRRGRTTCQKPNTSDASERLEGSTSGPHGAPSIPESSTRRNCHRASYTWSGVAVSSSGRPGQRHGNYPARCSHRSSGSSVQRCTSTVTWARSSNCRRRIL